MHYSSGLQPHTTFTHNSHCLTICCHSGALFCTAPSLALQDFPNNPWWGRHSSAEAGRRAWGTPLAPTTSFHFPHAGRLFGFLSFTFLSLCTRSPLQFIRNHCILLDKEAQTALICLLFFTLLGWGWGCGRAGPVTSHLEMSLWTQCHYYQNNRPAGLSLEPIVCTGVCVWIIKCGSTYLWIHAWLLFLCLHLCILIIFLKKYPLHHIIAKLHFFDYIACLLSFLSHLPLLSKTSVTDCIQ